MADSAAVAAPAESAGVGASESTDEERTEGRVEPASSGPLDLNRAELEQLVRLPGIGPVKAKAIVERRIQHGAFASVEDLVEVSGIGPKTLERLSGLVTVEAKSPVREEAR